MQDTIDFEKQTGYVFLPLTRWTTWGWKRSSASRPIRLYFDQSSIWNSALWSPFVNDIVLLKGGFAEKSLWSIVCSVVVVLEQLYLSLSQYLCSYYNLICSALWKMGLKASKHKKDLGFHRTWDSNFVSVDIRESQHEAHRYI